MRLPHHVIAGPSNSPSGSSFRSTFILWSANRSSVGLFRARPKIGPSLRLGPGIAVCSNLQGPREAAPRFKALARLTLKPVQRLRVLVAILGAAHVSSAPQPARQMRFCLLAGTCWSRVRASRYASRLRAGAQGGRTHRSMPGVSDIALGEQTAVIGPQNLGWCLRTTPSRRRVAGALQWRGIHPSRTHP